MAVSATVLGKRLLRLFGVTSLNPASPANQPFPIEPTDLDDIVGVINSSLQDIFDTGPLEDREKNLGGSLHGPTAITLTATNGSSVISGLTTYAAWMLGCTIRISGDSQDNELTSATQLVRPYQGTTGSVIPATIYGDCIQLDDTVSKVLSPVSLPNQIPLISCTDRFQFMRQSGYPLVVTSTGSAYGYPFFWFVQKIISRPLFWYLEGAYTAGLSYVPRRIRVGPMPDQPYAIGYKAAMTATSIAATDIDPGDHTTDPGVLFPLPDSQVESILYPICCQKLTGLAQFKNDGTKAEIARAYRVSLDRLRGIRAQGAVTFARYV